MREKDSPKTGISKLIVKDFKALNHVELNLRPLNYLLGENSLGKSSVSQALRLIAMNLRDSDPQRFRLNLPGLKLGQFEKVVSEGTDSGFHIGIEVRIASEPKTDDKMGTISNTSVSAHFNIDEVGTGGTFSDIVRNVLQSKRDVAVVSRPGMKTKVPLQWIGIATDNANLRISPTFVGRRRWISGQIGEMKLPTGTFVELKDKNLLGSIASSLNRGSSSIEFQAPLLIESDFEFLEDEHYKASEADFRADGNILRISVKDAFMLHLSMLKHQAEESEYREFTGGQIYGPEIIPTFRLFLERPLVTVRDIVRDQGEDYSGNNDAIISLIQKYAMDNPSDDVLVWRDKNDIANDATLDQIFYWLEVDITGFDATDLIIHVAERDLTGFSSNFYDFWQKPVTSSISEQLVTQIQNQLNQSNNLITQHVHYVGPLRGDGYTVQNLDKEIDSFLPVGLVGEQLVQALVEDFETPTTRNYLRNFRSLMLAAQGKVSNFRPVYRYPNSTGSSTDSLLQALESWINFFEFGAKLEISDLGVLGHQVFIDKTNLYHLGSGVSQVLPVITACLLSEPGSLTIIEQPELHLHPAAQQKLADFFLVMAQSGRNLLIETHSEYMINRTRRDVVLEKARADEIQLFFAERTDGQTTIREANLSGSGGFEYWPKGFFSQTEDDLLDILRAIEDS